MSYVPTWVASLLLAASLTVAPAAPWGQVVSFPLGSAALVEVSCPTAQSCEALGASSSGAYDLTLRTTDGARRWSAGVLPAGITLGPARPGGFERPLEAALSCPTTERCVTFGHAATSSGEVAVVSGDGGRRWATVKLPGAPTLVSGAACPSRSDCVAVGEGAAGAIVLRSIDGGEQWTSEPLPAGSPTPLALACPSVASCLAVLGTAIFASRDGGRSWARAGTLPRNLTATSLSCSSTRHCVAVGRTPSSSAAASTEDGGAHWRVTALAGYSLEAVSCPSASSCVAVGFSSGSGCCTALGATAFHSLNGGLTWRSQPLPRGTVELDAVACPAASYCRAVGDAAVTPPDNRPAGLKATADYLSPGRRWAAGRLPVGIVSLSGVTCGSSALCQVFGVNTTGSSVAYRVIDGRRWRPDRLPVGVRLVAMSCGSARHCVALARQGGSTLAIVSTDGGKRWQPVKLSRAMAGASSISCPTAARCVAAGETAAGWTVTAVSGDGGRLWRPGPVQKVMAPFALDCPTARRCYGAGEDTFVTSADGGAKWRRLQAPVEYAYGLDCAAAADCIVVGYNHAAGQPGEVVERTTDGGASWLGLTLPGKAALDSVSCASPRDCVATEVDGGIWRTTDGGASWRRASARARMLTSAGVACSRAGCILSGQTSGRALVLYGSASALFGASQQPRENSSADPLPHARPSAGRRAAALGCDL